MRIRSLLFGALPAVLLLACKDDGVTPIDTTPLCSAPAAVTLAVGESRIYDPFVDASCLRLPGGAAASEYLVVAYSGYGQETGSGLSASFAFQGRAGELPVAAPTTSVASLDPVARLFQRESPQAFHRQLRVNEQSLATSPAARFGNPALTRAAPVPVLGEKDSFFVCQNLNCSGFNKVGATVKYVGNPGAVYVDDNSLAGAEVLTLADIEQLGDLFDDYLYAADTTAFGRESDVNLDGHIAILITPAVNALTPDCSAGRVVGYTYGNDLISSSTGSNRREMFYAFAPQAGNGTCTAVTRARALSALPTVIIHEMQHMISFNQHVLMRGGNDQDLWLNEGLSHFAEELGFRVTPDAQCPNSPTCFAQFADGDLRDAYDYLNDPEATFLIAPSGGGATLEERGIAWLFVRWMADHFAADTLGTQFTRATQQTTMTGATAIAAISGVPFVQLAAEWHLANYLEGLAGFPQAGRLYYKSWNFRAVYLRNYPSVFQKPYPLTPDSTSGTYNHSGTLRAGSGHHMRFAIPAGAPGVTIRIAGSTNGSSLSAGIIPRFVVVRIK